jgi:deoxyadenosine/deoxycytidine kinase
MYIVEGTIGAGKSTFLRLIEQRLSQVAVIYEPVDSWQSEEHGSSLLTQFYTNPARWAYSMETFAMACRVKEHLKEQQEQNRFRLMERSIYSGHYCFTYNGYLQGFLTELEWQVYLEWFNFLIPGKCKAPTGFIYLKVDPKVAHARIQKRSRSGESGIPLDYLYQLQARHEDFLVHKKQVLQELYAVPVLVLDCNTDFESDPAVFAVHAEKIAAFMGLSL